MVEFENIWAQVLAIVFGCAMLLASLVLWLRASEFRRRSHPSPKELKVSWLDFSITVWAYFFLFIALSLIAQHWLLAPESLNQSHRETDVPWNVILYGFVIQMTFIVILLGVKVSFKIDFLPATTDRSGLKYAFLAGAEMLVRFFPLLWALSLIWMAMIHLLNLDSSIQEAVNFLLQIKDPFKLLAVVMVSMIGAPLLEELFFRGFVLRTLMQKLPFWVANGSTSVIFALLHFNLPSLVPIFALSLLLGLLFKRTGDVRAAVFMHALFNSYSVVFILIERFAPTQPFPS